MAEDPAGGTSSGDDVPRTRAQARQATEPTASSFQSHVRAARSEFEHQIDRARADFEHANERINARTGRNLFLAIAIGVGIGLAVLGSLLWIKWLFLVLAIPLCLLGVFEFSRALQAAGRRVDVWPQLVAGAVIMLSALLGHTTHWVLTFAAVAAVLVWRMIGQMAAQDARRYSDVLQDVLAAGLIALYVPFLASLAVVLLRQEQGELWVLTMLVIVIAADTGAYASGLAFGKHPMAPKISPKKTWEGFAGAVVAAVVAAILMGVFLLHLPIWASAALGVLILLTATVGDLGESMIKRDLGIKDMSSWLPGHGGVLDRLDSILPSTAVALGLYVLFFPLVVA
ncbi:phosphatidate cytidylyltransferase [Microbacterium telephonicum]|uniref:Phosphatidate cytidylyltransferase n=1 Tax=Microbacterium telephonicum TaxID=1714841 RepID=A0A498C111_9MICO|nr:phosphatidate cytidylyltransferase [Microbacterium telephonicum]RLK49315.1 phosphatidate cytidylyltransferase [Microbacterium telephonicum]